MWLKSRLTQATAKLSSLTASSRSRRIIFIILVILVLFMYFGPSYFGGHRNTSKSTEACLKRRLSEYSDFLEAKTVLISRPDKEGGDYPFIGNGNIGVKVKSGGPVFIRHHNKMSVKIPYAPLVQAYQIADVHEFKEATVIDYKTGEANLIQAFSVMGSCVIVENKVYAHRAKPSVLVQEINVDNPLMLVLEVNLRRLNIPWENSKIEKVNDYTVQMGKVTVQHHLGSTQSIVATVTISDFATQLFLVAQSSRIVHITNLVEYSEPMLDTQITLNAYNHLKGILKTDADKLLPINYLQLKGEHSKLWQELWQAGISVEQPSQTVDGGSHATGRLPNLDTTFYYALSSAETPPLKQEEIAQLLSQHGSCYNGLPTLFDKSYWSPVKDHQEYLDLMSLWTHTLYKQGCVNYLRAGTTGVMQAMLLSLLGGQFTDNHLSFSADPRLFRHNTFIKGISYGGLKGGTFDLDIRVSSHQVAVRQSLASQQWHADTTLYACGAGCTGEPVKLTGSELMELPLDWTRPKTSFLYIAKTQSSLQELKKMIHFKTINSVEVTEKPEPHVHPSQSLHIPTSIWLLIASLVIVFHLFLIKIIYNEYCQKNLDNKPRIKPLQYT